MSDQNATIGPNEAKARPTPRITVLAQKTKQIAAELQAKQAVVPEGHPGWLMFLRITRMFVAFVFVLILGFVFLFPAWNAMMKADELRMVDAVRIGIGLLLMYVPFWIAARDRAEAFVKFLLAILMAWKRQPPVTP